MTLPEMLDDLPQVCDVGSTRNARGYNLNCRDRCRAKADWPDMHGKGTQSSLRELDVLGHDHDLGAGVAVAVFPALLPRAAHAAYAASLGQVLGAHRGEFAPGGGVVSKIRSSRISRIATS